jgi:hypothetical protein
MRIPRHWRQEDCLVLQSFTLVRFSIFYRNRAVFWQIFSFITLFVPDTNSEHVSLSWRRNLLLSWTHSLFVRSAYWTVAFSLKAFLEYFLNQFLRSLLPIRVNQLILYHVFRCLLLPISFADNMYAQGQQGKLIFYCFKCIFLNLCAEFLKRRQIYCIFEMFFGLFECLLPNFLSCSFHFVLQFYNLHLWVKNAFFGAYNLFKAYVFFERIDS